MKVKYIMKYILLWKWKLLLDVEIFLLHRIRENHVNNHRNHIIKAIKNLHGV